MKALKTPIIVILLAVLATGIFSQLNFQSRLAEARAAHQVVAEGTVVGEGVMAMLQTPDGRKIPLRMVINGAPCFDLSLEELSQLEEGDYILLVRTLDDSGEVPTLDVSPVKV